jgi:hypothetical protein
MGVERRGRIIRGLFVRSTGQVREELCERAEIVRKPFDISKQQVWEAYLKVKANKGAPGVDDCSLADFEGISSPCRAAG